jgi:GlpG protein
MSEDDLLDIWILADDDMENAKRYLEEFSQNPQATSIKQQVEQGRKQWLQERKTQQAAETKAAKQLARRQGNFLSSFPVTAVVIAISVVFFLYSYAGKSYELTKYLLFSSSYAELVLGHRTFQEILSGQVWRLVTPIFIHKGIFHIFFNLAWFLTLARHIEGHISSRKLLLLIFATAIPSHIAFYLVAGPAFGGLSGVNYGLFAYLWFRGNYSPNVSLRPDPQLSQFFLVWYLICLGLSLAGNVTGMKVANTIHGVGAAMGILVAIADNKSLRHIVRSLGFSTHLRKQLAIACLLLLAGFVVDYLSY